MKALKEEAARNVEKAKRIIKGFAGMYEYTQEELAAVCGMSTETWRSRMREPGSFRLAELAALARSFGVSLAELMEGQGGSRK